MKTLPDSKRKNVVKKVKKTFNARCIRLHFSMLNAFDNILRNTTSSEFSMYGHSKINVLSNHFFANQKENKGTFIEWESFKFDLVSMRKKWINLKKTCQEIT